MSVVSVLVPLLLPPAMLGVVLVMARYEDLVLPVPEPSAEEDEEAEEVEGGEGIEGGGGGGGEDVPTAPEPPHPADAA